MPPYVKDFMRHVPSVWDESKIVDGYPGKLAVMARKGQNDPHWYVAGINGEAQEKKLSLDLSFLPAGASGVLITDGEGQLFGQQAVKLVGNKQLSVTLKPNGGFVVVFDSKK